MAYQPNDPFRDPMTDEELRRQARFNRLDNDLQADPELAEGPASGAKIAMFAVAIAVVLGALFYGLNNTSVHQAGTTPPAQTAQTQPANPPASGMRDVTPKPNTAPGTTTGAAPARPAIPPADNADTSKSANPPASNAPASK